MNTNIWTATNKSLYYVKAATRYSTESCLNCYPYLLGLLAKIKCSICSNQCESWFSPFGGRFFTFIFELPDCAACRQRLGRSPGAFTFLPWGQQNFRFTFCFSYVSASLRANSPRSIVQFTIMSFFWSVRRLAVDSLRLSRTKQFCLDSDV